MSENPPTTIESESRTEARVDAPSDVPNQMMLELVVEEPETIIELCRIPAGELRVDFALKALRIGVLALKQARGEIDVGQVRREVDHLLHVLDTQLQNHAERLHEKLVAQLTQYFDPQSGKFQERVERLIRKDGDLEQVLLRQIGHEDSELCKTLAAHIGENSPLMLKLDPERSDGLLASLRVIVQEQLDGQREHVLRQFSLDNKEGALSRFIDELAERQGELSKGLAERLDEVVDEFSLDKEDSALSRLVKNVDGAQRTITQEFSLDSETSALSRLKKMLDDTNQAIEGHLSLDDEKSALFRLKRELLAVLKDQSDKNSKFQEEVKGALREISAKKAASQRSTIHGIEFEAAVADQLQGEAQKVGDGYASTGHETGLIKNCKVGDCVVTLGPDSAAPNARFVIEAKEKSGYTMAAAREEIETARKNRDSQVGLFVFSRKAAPQGIASFSRYGRDIFVVWDSEDQSTDVFFEAGFSLARALCIRERGESTARTADFTAIDAAILEVERRAGSLDEVETWTSTIKSHSEKILTRISATRGSLVQQVEILRQKTEDLRTLVAPSPESV